MSLFGSSDLHSLVNKSIKKVREQGTPPERDILAGENFFRCDICRDSFKRSSLVQCGLCGRWACREACWSKEGICITCQGVVNLSKESVKLEIRKTKAQQEGKQEPQLEPEKKTKKRMKTPKRS